MNKTRASVLLRIIVIVLTALIWLIGATVLGFSLWLRLDFWINQYVSASDELTKYTVAVYFFIATGAVIILFGIVGIYGAARPDRFALIVYLIFLPVVFGMMMGAGIYGYIYREEIENTIKNSDLLREIVEKQYGVEHRVTSAFDYMQLELKCCGGTSYTDYLTSVWSLDAPLHQDERKNKAPLTCCKDYWRYKDAPPNYKYCSIYIIDPSGDLQPDINYNIHQIGCGEAIVKFFRKNLNIVAAIGFTVVGLLFITIICVSLLLCYLRKSPVPTEDDVVYEMARTQEKSPYPARGGPYANLYQS